ncbi:MAG: JmjC domain-containing protein [Holosporales bacterium]
MNPHPSFSPYLQTATWHEFKQNTYQKSHAHLALNKALRFSWQDLEDMIRADGASQAQNLGLYHRGHKVQDGLSLVAGLKESGNAGPGVLHSLMAEGATLVWNDVANLHSEIMAFATSLATSLRGRVQANLYASQEGQQGFQSHFDVHDVFAVHLVGEKTWRLYQGREDLPISHPRYHQLDQAYFDAHKGEVLAEVTLKPGDLLYLPRGTYHDALATSGVSLHIAFGLTTPLGLDVISALFEALVSLPWGRQSLPEDPHEHAAFLREGTQIIQDLMTSSAFRQQLIHLQHQLIAPQAAEKREDTSSETYSLSVENLKVIQRHDGYWLSNPQAEVRIPEGGEQMVNWILEQKRFCLGHFDEAFATHPASKRQYILEGLCRMGILGLEKN